MGKKVKSILFHRITVVGLLLLFQVVQLAVVMVRFADYFIYFYWFCIFISVLVVLWIVNDRSDPGYKIAWLIPILLFPVFGGLFYLAFGGNRMSKRTRRRMQGMERKMLRELGNSERAEELVPFGADAVNQSRYLERYACAPV